jgi:hypothetical protein
MPPVMKLPASEARSRARPRISFGSPIRPNGITAFHMSSLLAPVGVALSAALALVARLALPRLVLNGPGAIAFTRTPQRARSWAACLVKLTTAALAIAYEYGVYGSLRRPAVEAVVMIEPARCRFMCLAAACTV